MLLTSEYAVLDGAKAIALPTKLGQSLTVKASKGSDLYWSSLDANGGEWFSAQISLFDFSALKTSDEVVAAQLKKLLKNAVRLNSEFLSKWNGFKVETKLDFPRNWGLGSSSSLTYLVAEWADVHPLLLHFKTNSGSGYDVACAGADGPIIYQLAGDEIKWEEIDFEPSFRDQVHFVFLGSKQSTQEGIAYYTKKVKDKKSFVSASNKITEAVLESSSLKQFQKALEEQEKLVAKTLELETVKEKFFSDFEGIVKSLGAWGGDFAIVVSEWPSDKVKAYFKNKGLEHCIPYKDFVL